VVEGLLASYAQVLRHLHTTGERLARNRLLTQPPQVQMRPRNPGHTEGSLAARAAGRRILVIMSPYPARSRRHLATSPFGAPDPEPPAECFAVGDKVTHDKYGLGTVTGVEEGIALLIDFGSDIQRILTPSAKLSKL
jgi:hypothetical protein